MTSLVLLTFLLLLILLTILFFCIVSSTDLRFLSATGSVLNLVHALKQYILKATFNLFINVLNPLHATFLGQAPRYLCDLIRRPISATSGRPLRSLDHHDLLVPRSRTATAQHRAYASVGPLLWNDLPAITRAVMLSGGTTVSARSLKTFLFSRGPSHWKRL